MNAKRVFVVGMGAMGSGIVQACAQAGHQVVAVDASEAMRAKGLTSIQQSLAKMSEGGKLRETKEALLARIEISDSLRRAADADLVIEAISEDLEIKQNLFRELSQICSPSAVLATNTSSIPITEIAVAVSNPERFVGIHFFNPVHRMKLIEVVRGILTSDQTVALAREFATSLGKEPIVVNKDTAGFIVNRINGMAILEALRLLEKGVASPEDIDKAMRLGLGHPIGPFEFMDMVGLDIVAKARMGIYEETKDPSHYPPVTLMRKVKAGHLGRKTGKGFYEY
ncbi:3-hydroxyacyl-CoA dehydrogenase family protein [Geobacter argillaceus]|uniref:3-hydroxybutyryl-CoA dehydrogenase n=1 Tax=Geobacter argillaceus TaxID=345631 RepID=A0A562VHF0_9BACT|nr:3-hydroxyacyl-CoA dehydrogenase family protein [Geobacter argillaceus]TWJ17356.1 3-hydroxybutyryl-CoA dehydrogenase [Geobacter argillaceus]